MNPKLNQVLEQIRSNLSEHIGGVGNIKPVDMKKHDPYNMSVRDQFFDLMDEIADSLRLIHGVSAEKAFSYAAGIGDKLELRGLMPKFPVDGMHDSAIAKWVSAAAYSNFKSHVLSNATMDNLGE